MKTVAEIGAARALSTLLLFSLGCGSSAADHADAKGHDAIFAGFDVDAPKATEAADGGVDTPSGDHAAATDAMATDDANADATTIGLDADAAKAMDAADGAAAADASVDATCLAPSPDAAWVAQDPSSASPATRNRVSNVFAIRRDDVWVVVAGFQDPETGAKEPPELLRWNGTAFTLMFSGVVSQPFPPPPPNTPPDQRFDKIWASGPNDVWVTGDRFRHWDGAAWSDRTPPGADSVATVHGRGPNDVWVDAFKPPGPIDRLLLAHWNGSSWIDMTPPPLDPSTTLVFGGGTWASVSTQLVPPPLDPTTVGVFNSNILWESAPDDLWAAGGTAIPAPPPSTGLQGNADVLQHWDGRAWTAWADTSHATFSMWGSSPTDVWRAGYTFDHFDGQAWTTVIAAPDIATLWGSCATDVWAGLPFPKQTWHFDGTSWAVDASAAYDVYSISGTSADDLWMAWGTGNLAHRTLSPGSWQILNF